MSQKLPRGDRGGGGDLGETSTQTLSVGSKIEIPGLDVSALLPLDLSRYYRYEGSLTTPPCSQGVIWTVFNETVKLSAKQVRMGCGIDTVNVGRRMKMKMWEEMRKGPRSKDRRGLGTLVYFCLEPVLSIDPHPLPPSSILSLFPCGDLMILGYN